MRRRLTRVRNFILWLLILWLLVLFAWRAYFTSSTLSEEGLTREDFTHPRSWRIVHEEDVSSLGTGTILRVHSQFDDHHWLYYIDVLFGTVMDEYWFHYGVVVHPEDFNWVSEQSELGLKLKDHMRQHPNHILHYGKQGSLNATHVSLQQPWYVRWLHFQAVATMCSFDQFAGNFDVMSKQSYTSEQNPRLAIWQESSNVAKRAANVFGRAQWVFSFENCQSLASYVSYGLSMSTSVVEYTVVPAIGYLCFSLMARVVLWNCINRLPKVLVVSIWMLMFVFCVKQWKFYPTGMILLLLFMTTLFTKFSEWQITIYDATIWFALLVLSWPLHSMGMPRHPHVIVAIIIITVSVIYDYIVNNNWMHKELVIVEVAFVAFFFVAYVFHVLPLKYLIAGLIVCALVEFKYYPSCAQWITVVVTLMGVLLHLYFRVYYCALIFALNPFIKQPTNSQENPGNRLQLRGLAFLDQSPLHHTLILIPFSMCAIMLGGSTYAMHSILEQ